jgi:hypothetical protein
MTTKPYTYFHLSAYMDAVYEFRILHTSFTRIDSVDIHSALWVRCRGQWNKTYKPVIENETIDK